MKLIIGCLSLLMLCNLSYAGTYSGGSGTPAEPYQIATAEDLVALGNTATDYGMNFVLTQNVDLAGYFFAKSVISPSSDRVNFKGTKFTGIFDGNNYTISNLTIDSGATRNSFLGLFGCIGSGGKVANLRLTNMITKSGGWYLGGLAGMNNGSISNCSVSGSHIGIVTSSHYIGGLVAYNSGNIVDCYFTGSLQGYSKIGGLTGRNSGIIICSYAVGSISGKHRYLGGLVGENYIGSISNCYASVDVSGNDTSVGGLVGSHTKGNIVNCYASGTVIGTEIVGGLVGYIESAEVSDSYYYKYCGPENDCGNALDDDQLQDKASFKGFDFAGDNTDGTEDVWTIESGYMPRLSWQSSPGITAPYRLAHITTTLEGSGYPATPFIIASYDDLLEFKTNTELRVGYFSLKANIDMAGVVYPQAFIPERFYGNFSGNGYIISNLTIVSDLECLGFFSRLVGTVDDLGLENISINGNYLIGGLAGLSYYGNINNCYVTGSISGGNRVGGLVGYNSSFGIINGSHANVIVNSNGDSAGGLAGTNIGTIDGSYATAAVNGIDVVGGLVGYNYNSGTISSCHATGLVNGKKLVGGLVGYNKSNSYIKSSFATGSVSGESSIGGLVGDNGYYSHIIGSYATGSVQGVSFVGGLVGDGNSGGINWSYATGPANGDSYVGGLVGDNSGTIGNSYTTGPASGNSYVGGLAGRNSSDIRTSYATGTVSCSGDYAGGLVGFSWQDDAINCYFYLYGGPDNSFGIALDDGQLQNKASFAGFNFTAYNNSYCWIIEPGYMPRLSWQSTPGIEAPYRLDKIITTLDGKGYPATPFVIADYDDLMEFRNNPELRIGYYSLEADIDLAGSEYIQAFIPEYFAGNFAGNGHSISRLSIEADSDHIGFFSRLYGGSLDNLYLNNVQIFGNEYVGGLVGSNIFGSISGSGVDGTISGGNKVGGLIGYNDSGNIEYSCVFGSVVGISSVGGLVGENHNGCIVDSYVNGATSGSGDNIGGLVGYNYVSYIFYNIISRCYVSGPVSGNVYVGGLFGYSDSSWITTACFWDTDVCSCDYGIGNNAVDNVIGLSTSEMYTQEVFAAAGWKFSVDDGDVAVWQMVRPGEDYPRLAWQPAVSGDIAGLWGVDLADMELLAENWLEESTEIIADINTDGEVNLLDFAIMSENWLLVN